MTRQIVCLMIEQTFEPIGLVNLDLSQFERQDLIYLPLQQRMPVPLEIGSDNAAATMQIRCISVRREPVAQNIKGKIFRSYLYLVPPGQRDWAYDAVSRWWNAEITKTDRHMDYLLDKLHTQERETDRLKTQLALYKGNWRKMKKLERKGLI